MTTLRFRCCCSCSLVMTSFVCDRHKGHIVYIGLNAFVENCQSATIQRPRPRTSSARILIRWHCPWGAAVVVDDVFNCDLLDEICCILIIMSIRYVVNVPIDNKSALVQVNTLGSRKNGSHFADDIFKCIFVNENVWIPIKISPKFVPKDPIDNIPALVQIMAWRCAGDKPLSEPMMVSHSASMN